MRCKTCLANCHPSWVIIMRQGERAVQGRKEGAGRFTRGALAIPSFWKLLFYPWPTDYLLRGVLDVWDWARREWAWRSPLTATGLHSFHHLPTLTNDWWSRLKEEEWEWAMMEWCSRKNELLDVRWKSTELLCKKIHFGKNERKSCWRMENEWKEKLGKIIWWGERRIKEKEKLKLKLKLLRFI